MELLEVKIDVLISFRPSPQWVKLGQNESKKPYIERSVYGFFIRIRFLSSFGEEGVCRL